MLTVECPNAPDTETMSTPSLDKYIYDENSHLWYGLQEDFYIPHLSLLAEEKVIVIWWKRHRHCLQEHKKAACTTLLTSRKLSSYFADIDEQAQEHFELLIEDMKQTQGNKEQLKTENTLKRIGRTNNIRACTVENVNEEIIYA